METSYLFAFIIASFIVGLYTFKSYKLRIYSLCIQCWGSIRDFIEKFNSFQYSGFVNSKRLLNNTYSRIEYHPVKDNIINEGEICLCRTYLNDRMQPMISIYPDFSYHYKSPPSVVSFFFCVLYILTLGRNSTKVMNTNLQDSFKESHSANPDAIKIEHKWFIAKPRDSTSSTSSVTEETENLDEEIDAFPEDF